MKYTLNIFIAAAMILSSCKSQAQNEPTSDPFDEVGTDLPHVVNIASKTEPGERIKITGVVYESDGKTPAKGVMMYFYHTDEKGVYAKHGNEPRNSLAWWHGYHRGWLKTNDKGEYEINTIKPAPYPARVEPAHIHVLVKAPSQKKSYDIGAITFKGDDLATEKYWYAVEQYGHPRDGGTELKKNRNGILEGRRDYVLYAQYDIAAINSGLLPGEECPAFQPRHATGADKGSKACPMCKYGYKQGVMAWVNSDNQSDLLTLCRFLESKITEVGVDKMRAFIIYMNPGKLSAEKVDAKLKELAKTAGLKYVALLYLPSADDRSITDRYRINPNRDISNTVFVYKNRKVVDKYVNLTPSPENLEMLMSSVRNTITNQVTSNK